MPNLWLPEWSRHLSNYLQIELPLRPSGTAWVGCTWTCSAFASHCAPCFGLWGFQRLDTLHWRPRLRPRSIGSWIGTPRQMKSLTVSERTSCCSLWWCLSCRCSQNRWMSQKKISWSCWCSESGCSACTRCSYQHRRCSGYSIVRHLRDLVCYLWP